jgi:phosphohistidine phosphatase
MKRLYIIRHAKSSWKEADIRDLDRPLNKRGEHDAPLMGKLLRDRGVLPDLIVSSPANRARTTARIIANEVGFAAEGIVLESTIYEAYLEDLVSIVQSLPNRANTVFLFGHNPALTYLANHFNTGELIMNVPTCGVCGIETSADDWSKIHPSNSSLVSFDYPKKYFYN